MGTKLHSENAAERVMCGRSLNEGFPLRLKRKCSAYEMLAVPFGLPHHLPYPPSSDLSQNGLT